MSERRSVNGPFLQLLWSPNFWIETIMQYTMDQLFLPMDLEEDIPQNHLVHLVNATVNRLDEVIFDAAYPGNRRHSYHPKMLTKVIIYAYTQRIYSSRQIAKSIR